MSERPPLPCQVCGTLGLTCTNECLIAQHYGRHAKVIDFSRLKSFYNWSNLRRRLVSLPPETQRIAIVSLNREAYCREQNFVFGEALTIFNLRAENRGLKDQNIALQEILSNLMATPVPTQQPEPAQPGEQGGTTDQDKGKKQEGETSQFETGSSSEVPPEGDKIVDLTGRDDDYAFLTQICELPTTPAIPTNFGTELDDEAEEKDDEDLFSIVSGATKRRRYD